MKKVKKIKAVSSGKMLGVMYGLMGLIFGSLISIITVLGSTLFASGDSKIGGIVLGVGAVIFIPLIYSVFGFIFGIILGWFYNVAAKWVGGLEVEIREE